jgi:hypothetical protein
MLTACGLMTTSSHQAITLRRGASSVATELSMGISGHRPFPATGFWLAAVLSQVRMGDQLPPASPGRGGRQAPLHAEYRLVGRACMRPQLRPRPARPDRAPMRCLPRGHQHQHPRSGETRRARPQPRHAQPDSRARPPGLTPVSRAPAPAAPDLPGNTPADPEPPQQASGDPTATQKTEPRCGPFETRMRAANITDQALLLRAAAIDRAGDEIFNNAAMDTPNDHGP